MATIKIKKGDRLPFLPFQLIRRNEDGAFEPADCTGRTGKLIAKNLATGSVKINTAVVFDTISQGLGHYEWAAADVDTAGVWSLEIETTVTASGLKETFPNGGHDILIVVEDLA